MWIWLALTLTPQAHGGCAVDTDESARQAAAPLVAVGVVTGLELREEADGRVTVFARVRADDVLEGSLEHGGLRIRSGLPSHVDVSPSVPAPGTALYVIGEPDADGAIASSPCTSDVGRPGGRIRPEEVARGKGGRFDGVAPEVPPDDGPSLPDTPTGWWVHAAFQGVPRPLAWISDGADHVTVVAPHTASLEVATRLPTEALAPVVGRDWPVAPDAELRWRAGTPLDDAGQPRAAGVHALAPLPPEAAALRWQASPRPQAPEGVAEVEAVPGATLHAAPEGPAIVRLDADPGLFAVGVDMGGWQRVALTGAAPLSGEAWLRTADIADLGVGGIAVAGWAGGAMSNTDPVPLQLPAGLEIRRQGAGEVFARVTQDADFDWLTTGTDRAWVVVPTPDGPRVGEVPCVPASERTRCRVPAPRVSFEP